MGFGHKQAWLAVRDGDIAAVVAALGLRDLGPAPWRTAVDMAYLTDDRVVVTPPLAGAGGPWVLVAGRWLLLHAYPTLDLGALSAILDTEPYATATATPAPPTASPRHITGHARRAGTCCASSSSPKKW